MVKPTTFETQNWLLNQDKVFDIDHYENCKYVTTTIPMNEAPCKCYDMQLFLLGMRAQADLFNGADR